MRKFFIIIFLLLMLICRVSAMEKPTDTLSKIEDSVLGTTYSNQKVETRLNRLEKQVYGTTKKGKSQDRLKRLAKDLNADMIGQEITPPEDTLGSQDEYVSDSSVDYPIVDEVEKSLKINSKPNQSLHSRLVAIEKQLFHNVFDTDDFYTRVERIKGHVNKTNPSVLAQNYDDDDDIIDIPEYSDADPWAEWLKRRNKYKQSEWSSSSEYDSRISKLERKLFKNTYADENSSDRLARLENDVFDTEFYYDSESERLDRLEGAVKGQKTSHNYDTNKFQQGLNTALQIGAMILMVLACIL